MAWQDFMGMSVAEATAALNDLRAAKVSGRATEVVIAGVKSVVDPAQVNVSETIKELQKYLYEVNENGLSPSDPFDPYAQRPGITRVRFCG